MATKLQALREHLNTVHDLNMATAVLSWDQQTAMPVGGAAARAQQMSTLGRLSHELFTSDKTARLLDEAAAEAAQADYGSDEASLIRVTRQDYADATKLPTAFVAEEIKETALADQIWADARAQNDFAHFLPALTKVMELARRKADYLGYSDHPYDALLGMYERGMTTQRVRAIFDAHRPALVELISAITAAPQVDDSVLRRHYPLAQQREFGQMVVSALGFAFERGMQAVSVHPFCTHFSRDDVRITTRYDEHSFNEAFFGFLHEAGHGMYEQGIGANLEGSPLGGGTSLGVHESQSRLWENIVGRSRGFWSWALPKLREVFPAQLEGVTLETIYKAVNKVERSFIRVEADEATYNLHIILRFEIEQDLLTGKLKPADLPAAWNSRFTEFCGITPPNDTLGVLQDVHWSAGLIGYFPTYALGNMLSVQYYNRAVQDQPNIPADIAQGNFAPLLQWLNTHIHQHGRKFTADELTQRITGEGIQSRDYMTYLTTKYSEVYGLKS
jgi:carboxypeptidase Taq